MTTLEVLNSIADDRTLNPKQLWAIRDLARFAIRVVAKCPDDQCTEECRTYDTGEWDEKCPYCAAQLAVEALEEFVKP